MQFHKLKKTKNSRLIIIFLGYILLSCKANAQTNLPRQAIQIIGGYSKHGSGDMKGILFGAEYVKYFGGKFFLNHNFRGTINDGIDGIMVYQAGSENARDASIRFTTAGVQLGLNGGYCVVRNSRHELSVSIGAFGRYQSASNGADGYEIYQPSMTGVPTVLIGYDNRTPQRTVSLGGLFQLQYSLSFRNKILVGLAPGFQTDTNGDMIPYIGLVIGKKSG